MARRAWRTRNQERTSEQRTVTLIRSLEDSLAHG